MREITKFVANDGVEFESREGCLKHEELGVRVERIAAQLVPAPAGTEFASGCGYIQQDVSTVLRVRKELCELVIAEMLGGKDTVGWLTQTIENGFAAHWSWAARLIGEYSRNPRALDKLSYRLYATDNQGREWGQPYFAMNPGQGKDVCLNAETA